MATKNQTVQDQKDLYMMVNAKMYRASKSGVLRGQADLLNTLKRLHNLQVLARQKRDLKKKLQRLLTSAIKDITRIQEEMPDPKVPRKVKKHLKEETVIQVEEIKPEKKKGLKKSSFNEEIDAELQEIQEKLKQINA